MSTGILPISLYWRTAVTVFGTSLADGKHARWERYDVLGEIKPEKMPVWAKEALAKIKSQEKAKKSKSREER